MSTSSPNCLPTVRCLFNSFLDLSIVIRYNSFHDNVSDYTYLQVRQIILVIVVHKYHSSIETILHYQTLTFRFLLEILLTCEKDELFADVLHRHRILFVVVLHSSFNSPAFSKSNFLQRLIFASTKGSYFLIN